MSSAPSGSTTTVVDNKPVQYPEEAKPYVPGAFGFWGDVQRNPPYYPGQRVAPMTPQENQYIRQASSSFGARQPYQSGAEDMLAATQQGKYMWEDPYQQPNYQQSYYQPSYHQQTRSPAPIIGRQGDELRNFATYGSPTLGPAPDLGRRPTLGPAPGLGPTPTLGSAPTLGPTPTLGPGPSTNRGIGAQGAQSAYRTEDYEQYQPMTPEEMDAYIKAGAAPIIESLNESTIPLIRDSAAMHGGGATSTRSDVAVQQAIGEASSEIGDAVLAPMLMQEQQLQQDYAKTIQSLNQAKAEGDANRITEASIATAQVQSQLEAVQADIYRTQADFASNIYNTQAQFGSNIYNTQAQFGSNIYGTQAQYGSDIYGTKAQYGSDVYRTQADFERGLYDTQAQFGSNVYGTQAGLLGSAFGTEAGARTDIYGQDVGSASNKYNTDVGAASNRYNTDVGAASNRYNTDVGAATGMSDRSLAAWEGERGRQMQGAELTPAMISAENLRLSGLRDAGGYARSYNQQILDAMRSAWEEPLYRQDQAAKSIMGAAGTQPGGAVSTQDVEGSTDELGTAMSVLSTAAMVAGMAAKAMSTQALKTDIHRLSQIEKDELADALLEQDVKRWRYVFDRPGTLRFGAILEEMDPRFRFDNVNIDVVSMLAGLVATVQRQQRELNELKNQLASDHV